MWQSQKRNHIQYMNVFGFIFHMTFFLHFVIATFSEILPDFFRLTIGEKYEDPYYSFKVVMWYLKNNKWYNFLYVFMVKESAEIVIFVIKGQLLPQRSPKGHLRSFSANFSGLAPYFGILKNSKLISDDIFAFYMIFSF